MNNKVIYERMLSISIYTLVYMLVITMKRINVMVSDETKAILLKYKDDNKISTLDETVDKFVLENKA